MLGLTALTFVQLIPELERLIWSSELERILLPEYTMR